MFRMLYIPIHGYVLLQRMTTASPDAPSISTAVWRIGPTGWRH